MDDTSDTFVPVSSPVGSIMARLKAATALKNSDVLRETARATGNGPLMSQSAKCLLDYERHAEESQWFA